LNAGARAGPLKCARDGMRIVPSENLPVESTRQSTQDGYRFRTERYGVRVPVLGLRQTSDPLFEVDLVPFQRAEVAAAHRCFQSKKNGCLEIGTTLLEELFLFVRFQSA